jgi:uncharacterized membrane protein
MRIFWAWLFVSLTRLVPSGRSFKVDPSFTPSLLPSRAVIWTCRILCTIALGISGYLAYTAFNTSEVYGCGGGEVFDCGHVLNSRYAKILGMPVSVPAFGMYASLLGVLAFFRKETPEKLLSVGWGMLTVGALSAGLAALWFTSIQVFELQHLCAYCLGAHACGLIMAGIVIWKRPLGWGRLTQLSAFSVAGVALLITSQLTTEPPPTFVVETYENTPHSAEPQLTSFTAPGGAEEFDAPVSFAPPGETVDLIEAPATGPVVVDNLFAPPGDATENSAPLTESPQETKSANKEGDATTRLPEEAPVTGAGVQPASSAAAKSVYLFFSPTASQLAARLLLALPTDEQQLPGGDAGAAIAEGTTQTAAKPVVVVPKERLVTVAGSRFSLNTRHWPLLGDPDAKYVFVEMFDYTCPHCRNTHKAIEGAFSQFGDKLAIIALPVPLERSCNPGAKGNGHVGACEQARLAVAVWRCERSKFSDFHHWMFEANRTTGQARIKAEELVGKDQLAAELALGYAGDYVSKHVELYKRVGSGAVPKLMFPKSTMTGQVSSVTTLVTAIQREFPGN